MVGSAIPELIVCGSIKKSHVEQTSKQHASMAPPSRFLLCVSSRPDVIPLMLSL